MSIGEDKAFLERMAKGIATLFGPNCEIAIHDLEKGYDSSIVAIENGNVTNRRVGDGLSERIQNILRSAGDNVEDHYGYLARTKEGRVVKSSSIYIKDSEGLLTGLIDMSYDISDLMMAEAAIKNVISVPENKDSGQDGAMPANVNDLLDQLIEDSIKFIGKPVALMTKEDKIRAIQYLDQKGAFLIKKSGDKVSKYYDISKYTLYNYMDADM